MLLPYIVLKQCFFTKNFRKWWYLAILAVHSWHTYPLASLNCNIHKKIFLNQMPRNRKAHFKSPRFAQACFNRAITTPSPSTPSFCICLYILNTSIGIPLFANPLIIVVQQTRSLLSVLSNTTIASSTSSDTLHTNSKLKTQLTQETQTHNPLLYTKFPPPFSNPRTSYNESQDIVISSNTFQDHLTI